MPIFHYSNYESYDEAIIGFTEYCRSNDLPIGLSHSLEATDLASRGFSNDFQTMKYSMKALFCTKIEEHERFEKCFDVFWGKRRHEYSHKASNQTKTNVSKKANASLVMAGFKPNGKDSEKEEEEASNVTGSSKIESLKKTDFSMVSKMESGLLDELAEKLLRQLNHRLKRKLKATKRGKIDLRRTIRNNLSNGDTLLDLARKSRRQEKYRLILLLDVSGSMDKYSFFLLKFIWSLKSNLKNIETFVFSTKLIRITEFIDKRQLDHTLWQLTHNTDNWSGGTNIGHCFKEFNEKFSKRILNGKSITIVLSDGLDSGEPEDLSQEIQKIKMRTSKLVWLNPLKGMKGYAPEAKGMKTALPSLDEFGAANNLESLLELENILADV